MEAIHEGAVQMCLRVYLLLGTDLCAEEGLHQRCRGQGWGSGMLQGRGVGLLQGAPSGSGGKARVGHVRTKAGGSGNVDVVAALRNGVRTSGVGKTSWAAVCVLIGFVHE